MKQILLMGVAGVLCMGLAACQKNEPKTMWAPDVDTTMRVPPVNTGGTSKTAPYEHCNYGEDCAAKTKKVVVTRQREPGRAATTGTKSVSGGSAAGGHSNGSDDQVSYNSGVSREQAPAEKTCPYGADPVTCKCPEGKMEADGMCTSLQCRGGDCYYGEALCGSGCNSQGQNCSKGACFAADAGCEKLGADWVFGKLPQYYGCINAKEEIACRRQDNNLYECFKNTNRCGTGCNADGTNCDKGSCIIQTCNNIGGHKWNYTFVDDIYRPIAAGRNGLMSYGSCQDGGITCTKNGSSYTCYQGNRYKYRCQKNGTGC